MVQMIFGKKGTGKTKRLINLANEELKTTKGNVIFVDDDKRYMYDVSRDVRFIDVREYHIDTEQKLFGFVAGMLASNFDVSAIYIDKFLKISGLSVENISQFVKNIDEILSDSVKLVINVSADSSVAPQDIQGMII